MCERDAPEREDEPNIPSLSSMEKVARSIFAAADPPDPRKRKRGRAREVETPEAAG